MTDLSVILETILMLAAPFVPIAMGILLRRKFAPAKTTEGGEAVPMSGPRKAGRLLGTILVWAGILGILFMIVVVLNFKGKI